VLLLNLSQLLGSSLLPKKTRKKRIFTIDKKGIYCEIQKTESNEKYFLQVAIRCILDFPLWVIDGIRLRVPYFKKERCSTKILDKSVSSGFISRSGDADLNYSPPAEMIEYVFTVVIENEEAYVFVDHDQYRDKYIGDKVEVKYLRGLHSLRAALI
jgi:hypothetical protein